MLERTSVSLCSFRTDAEHGPISPPLQERDDDAFALMRARRALRIALAVQEDTQSRLHQRTLALAAAQDATLQRDRFIAMLGHDLRNSLQSIGMGAEQLKNPPSEKQRFAVIERIERSCGRMGELIQNVFDLTRSRFGGGIAMTMKSDDLLADELQQVIAEIRASHPTRAMDVSVRIQAPIVCDRHRLAQALANLLSNAVAHGSADQPVVVSIRDDEEHFEMVVSNAGPAIAPDRMVELFEPFTQGNNAAHHDGLGLGLYIASQIAASHGGDLRMTSDSALTRFTFRMANGRAIAPV